MPKAKVLMPIKVREKGKIVSKAKDEIVEVSQVAIDAMPNKLKAVEEKKPSAKK